MNASEFNTWNLDLCSKFPSLRSWQRNMGEAALTNLLEAWAEALADCELADLLAVNRRMLKGEDAGIGDSGSTWQAIPAHVRRLAFAARYRRLESEQPREQPELQQPRYRCKHCRDGGRLFVAHPAAVATVLKGLSLDKCHYREAVVRCSFCIKGRPRGPLESSLSGGERPRYTETVAEYDPDLHFLLPLEIGARLEGAMIEEFFAWVRTMKAKSEGGNRLKVFDQYNSADYGDIPDDGGFPR